MNLIYDNIFYIITTLIIGIIVATIISSLIKESKRQPTEKAVKLCNLFETDNWIMETRREGQNVALGFFIKEVLLKNTDRKISFELRYHTDYYGKVDYTAYNIRVKAPWLTENEEKDIAKYISKHRTLDLLIHPEIKELNLSDSKLLNNGVPYD